MFDDVFMGRVRTHTLQGPNQDIMKMGKSVSRGWQIRMLLEASLWMHQENGRGRDTKSKEREAKIP